MLLSQDPRLLRGQLQIVFKFHAVAITSGLVLVLLNGLVLWQLADQTAITLWLLLATMVYAVRYYLSYVFYRHEQLVSHTSWMQLHTIMTLFSAVIWAYALLVLMPDESLVHQFLMIISVVGFCSAVASSTALSPVICLLFLAICLVPMSVRLYAIGGSSYGGLLFGFCYIYLYFMWAICRRNTETVLQNLEKSLILDEKELALNEAYQRVDLHIDRSPLGIIEWDADLKVRRFNSAAESIFGYSAEQMLGQSFQKLLADDDPDYFLQIDHADKANPTTLKNLTSSGNEIHCEWTSATMRLPDGQLLGYSSFVWDITGRLERDELITHQAYYDAVTNLPNRHYLHDRLKQEISRSQRNKIYSAVLFLDVDHFKTINDSIGHSMGDLLLRQFAERLQNRMRQYDTVARFGGDVFVILIEALDIDYEKSQLQAAQVARSLQLLLQQPFVLNGAEYLLTCSIGITLFNDIASEDELLKQADLALTQSKQKGRNLYTFFEQEMSNRASRHLQLLNCLRNAVSNHEMSLVYQPKVDMHTNQIMGAETLLRWNSQDFGMVSPAEFIPVLEGSSLISQVGHWVLDQSFAQLKQWCGSGQWRKDMVLAINISPKQLLEKNFIEQVEMLLAQHDITASMLEFEITENVLVENTDRIATILTQLTDLGISFAIDDFGTGYSSLAYLKKLPLEVLKIDKSFIDHCTTEGNDQAIVRSILSICNELGLTSVAEGVESQEQQHQLQQMGCDLLQGYLFSRPVPAEEFYALLNP